MTSALGRGSTSLSGQSSSSVLPLLLLAFLATRFCVPGQSYLGVEGLIAPW
ncbi:hypothetical protein R69776_00858 [Paraburkholderia nemoris]|uniref:Uncharacterized protein n=1 Tax=Paraburkholderia nemoris TaxID=2793076 RepID=A0ABM8QMW0_9BURK|nr:hypothetical protein R69776_00858 [Paraburkholderia nemoris]